MKVDETMKFYITDNKSERKYDMRKVSFQTRNLKLQTFRQRCYRQEYMN